jgi:hypothetical protein
VVVNGSRASRWLVWTGPLFAVVFIVVGMVLEGNAPGEKASAEEVVKYFNAHHDRSLAQVFLAPALAAVLLLFASELRTRARALGVHGVGPSVLLSGAILWASGILVGSVLDLGLVSSSDHDQPQIAQTLNVLSNDDWIPFIGGLAIFLIGAGITVLGSRMLPKWLGWVALVAGIVSLAGPGGFIGFFVAPAWILVAGIVLGIRANSDVDGSAARTAAHSTPAEATQ